VYHQPPPPPRVVYVQEARYREAPGRRHGWHKNRGNYY
jgi:hypothetical protein